MIYYFKLFALNYISTARNARSTVQTEQAMPKGHGAGPQRAAAEMLILIKIKAYLWDSSMFHGYAVFYTILERYSQMKCHKRNKSRLKIETGDSFMTSKINMAGLTSAEAKKLQDKYGKNELSPQKKESFVKKVFDIVCEPMFLLLIAAAIIYFILGEPRDGAIMLIFVIGIISIDVVQEWKTDKTLSALKDLSAPHITVIRDGKEQDIPSADLGPGDLMMICEGIKIPADGAVIRCADLCIDESSLTGEAEGVWKVPSENAEPSADYWRKDYCYAGTLVTQGTGVILVDKIGAETEYGKIGLGVALLRRKKSSSKAYRKAC
jgi:magnesium-transporting ATPase (P-type)